MRGMSEYETQRYHNGNEPESSGEDFTELVEGPFTEDGRFGDCNICELIVLLPCKRKLFHTLLIFLRLIALWPSHCQLQVRGS